MKELDKQLHQATHDHDVERLLDAGADVNSKDENGKTALHHLVRHPDVDIWPLIHAGADINAQDSKGNTPIHALAASTGWKEFYNVEDDRWEDRFHKNEDAYLALVHADAKLDLTNDEGRTARSVYKTAMKLENNPHGDWDENDYNDIFPDERIKNEWEALNLVTAAERHGEDFSVFPLYEKALRTGVEHDEYLDRISSALHTLGVPIQNDADMETFRERLEEKRNSLTEERNLSPEFGLDVRREAVDFIYESKIWQDPAKFKDDAKVANAVELLDIPLETKTDIDNFSANLDMAATRLSEQENDSFLPLVLDKRDLREAFSEGLDNPKSMAQWAVSNEMDLLKMTFNPRHESPLASCKNPDALHDLVEHFKVGINDRNLTGNTPLHQYLKNQEVKSLDSEGKKEQVAEMVDCFIEKGANPKARNISLDTCEDLMKKSKHKEIYQPVLQKLEAQRNPIKVEILENHEEHQQKKKDIFQQQM